MRRGLPLALGLLAVMQLVPVSRTSSGGTVAAVDAPKPVVDVLRKACANCHSQTTVWPWYSRVAPVSWLIAHDVNHGREHLDFSTLSSLGARKKTKLFGEIAEEVDEQAMPPWYYLLMHPEARRDEAERRTIRVGQRRAGCPRRRCPGTNARRSLAGRHVACFALAKRRQ